MAGDWSLASLLLETHDYVWQRLLDRVDGLRDAEYLWEPVAGCWTVRRLDDGTLYRDPGEWPEVTSSPVTTIAWRICHIADNFLEARIGPLFGRPPFEGQLASPITAAEGIEYMTDAYQSWRAHVASVGSVGDADLAMPLARGTRPYEGKPLTRFVLQYLEELAHHAAEVALLRDLYRAAPQPS